MQVSSNSEVVLICCRGMDGFEEKINLHLGQGYTIKQIHMGSKEGEAEMSTIVVHLTRS